MLYAEIAIEVDSADGDRAEGALFEEGIAIEVRDQSTLLPPPPGRVVLVAYSPPDEAAAHAERITRLLGDVGVRSTLARQERDDGTWLDTWKAYFKARPVGPFVIVPSWERYEARHGETIISLDPGRAFGTGGHASTRLVLELIGRTPPVERFVDVGCGSGILAIACALRWRGASGLAIDVDPEAVATTDENSIINGVADRVAASTTAIEGLEERFGLVLANVSADVLSRLAATIAGLLQPGGILYTSGILVEQGDDVERAFTAVGLRRIMRLVDDEWVALGFEAHD